MSHVFPFRLSESESKPQPSVPSMVNFILVGTSVRAVEAEAVLPVSQSECPGRKMHGEVYDPDTSCATVAEFDVPAQSGKLGV